MLDLQVSKGSHCYSFRVTIDGVAREPKIWHHDDKLFLEFADYPVLEVSAFELEQTLDALQLGYESEPAFRRWPDRFHE
jgi:hypothetical protein